MAYRSTILYATPRVRYLNLPPAPAEARRHPAFRRIRSAVFQGELVEQAAGSVTADVRRRLWTYAGAVAWHQTQQEIA